jgi:PadR family transcriptional regulator PadR
MLKGLIELQILKILDDNKEIYAFELASLISKYSRGLINVTHPSLYPSLYRLKDKGYISIKEKTVANRNRKYYCLQNSGRAYYKKIRKEYEEITEGMKNVFEYTNDRKR